MYVYENHCIWNNQNPASTELDFKKGITSMYMHVHNNFYRVVECNHYKCM